MYSDIKVLTEYNWEAIYSEFLKSEMPPEDVLHCNKKNYCYKYKQNNNSETQNREPKYKNNWETIWNL